MFPGSFPGVPLNMGLGIALFEDTIGDGIKGKYLCDRSLGTVSNHILVERDVKPKLHTRDH